MATDAAGDATVADAAAGDATVTDAAAGDATVAGVVLGSGNVPSIQFVRSTLTAKTGKSNRGQCPTGSYYFNLGGAGGPTITGCCIQEQPPEYTAKPVVLTYRLVAGVENVCLEGAVGANAGTVCAPVDAGGLANFADSAERTRLYNYWGLNYVQPQSYSTLRVQLSSSRDLATMTFWLQGRKGTNGWEQICGQYVGTYVAETTVDIPLL